METANDTQFELWEVFIQTKPGMPYVHAGSVHASDKKMAIQNARDTFTRRGEGRSLWVVRSNHIVATDSKNEEMLFDPNSDKIYRHPTFYIMPEGATQI